MANDENTNTENELTIEELKSQASLYGIDYAGNISKVKLSEKIKEFKASTPDIEPVGSAISSEDDDAEYETEAGWQPKRVTRSEVKELKYQALLMLKVRITNLNPEESDSSTVYAGVISQYFKAARYIPFDRVWYVEQCLVDKLMVDKIQVFVNDIDPRTRRPNGNKKAKLVKHYNIEFVR